MKLLTSAASPFARKVRVLLRETGQIKTVKEVHVTTSPINLIQKYWPPTQQEEFQPLQGQMP